MTLGRRLFLQTLILSLCLTAALAIGALLLGELDGDGARIIFTTIFLAFASALALPAGVLLDHGRAPGLPQAVLLATAASLALSLFALWTDPEDDWVWQLAVTLALLAVLGAQICVSTWPRAPSDGPGIASLYWIAIVLSGAVIAVALAAIWTHDDDQGSARLIGALAMEPSSRRCSSRSSVGSSGLPGVPWSSSFAWTGRRPTRPSRLPSRRSHAMA